MMLLITPDRTCHEQKVANAITTVAINIPICWYTHFFHMGNQILNIIIHSHYNLILILKQNSVHSIHLLCEGADVLFTVGVLV